MRYYCYGDADEKCDKVSDIERQSVQTGSQMYYPDDIGLVIEDDTVYEIDEECIRCMKNRKSK